jgi:NADPH:quinone reductase-like Zn-dependent oxidoreductase
MGIVDGSGLGYECSGVVKDVGPEVQDLKIGDRVCVGAPNTYATILRVTSDHCARITEDLSFEEAATMPCVYGTVVHGLIDLARLEKGQVRIQA